MKLTIDTEAKVTHIREGRYFACHIPRYNIWFTAKSEDDIYRMAQNKISAFHNSFSTN